MEEVAGSNPVWSTMNCFWGRFLFRGGVLNDIIMFMNNQDKKTWAGESHEAAVDYFYGTGIEGHHNYHNGYLNFGYWTREGMSYEEAAENLVQKMGDLLGL